MRRFKSTTAAVDINLTPLIDVVFLLLVFFMVSTVFVKQQYLGLDLPQSGAASQVSKQNFLEISIDAAGTISYQHRQLDDNALYLLLFDSHRDTPLVISADKETQHQFVVKVMDVAAQLGFKKLQITTQQILKN